MVLLPRSHLFVRRLDVQQTEHNAVEIKCSWVEHLRMLIIFFSNRMKHRVPHLVRIQQKLDIDYP